MNESERTTAQQVLADGVAGAVALQGDMPLRCMWQFGSEGITVWDALNLLDYATHKERAALMRRELGYPDR